MKNFLVENKSEIIILDFQHLYLFGQSYLGQLIKFLLTQFQNMLCSWEQEINKISIASFHASGARLILIYPAIYHPSNSQLMISWLDPRAVQNLNLTPTMTQPLKILLLF